MSGPGSDDSQVRSIVDKINRTVFRSHINDTQIKKLERLANKTNAPPNSNHEVMPKKKRRPDSLALYLRDQHKMPKKGMQIIRLPKQPFGRHETYNREEDFINDHFIQLNSIDILKNNKELEELIRKFNLIDKKFNIVDKKVINTHQRSLSHDSNATHNMKAGNLFCKREFEIERIYDEDKDKYCQLNEYSPKKRTKHYRSRNMSFDWRPTSAVTDVVGRLHPADNFPGNELSKKMARRYSLLFERSSV